MNLFELTRALVDIESISGNEAAVGDYLADHLARNTGLIVNAFLQHKAEQCRYSVRRDHAARERQGLSHPHLSARRNDTGLCKTSQFGQR